VILNEAFVLLSNDYKAALLNKATDQVEADDFSQFISFMHRRIGEEKIAEYKIILVELRQKNKQTEISAQEHVKLVLLGSILPSYDQILLL
jgi:ABC-type tungstate transport system permease subunit